VNPASGSAIRYPTQRLSARVLPSMTIMPLTVSLAVDAGGLAVDSFVVLDRDLVNVFIDASHDCDAMMTEVCYGVTLDLSLYLFVVNKRLSPRSLLRPICNVRKSTGPLSTAEAEWRVYLNDNLPRLVGSYVDSSPQD
jgi:hypothetical protein